MIGLLANPTPEFPRTFLSQPGLGQCLFLLCQKTVLPTSRGTALPRPPDCPRPRATYRHIWCRPPSSKHPVALCPQHLLAQGMPVSHEQLVLYLHNHLPPPSISPTDGNLLQVQKGPGGAQNCMRPLHPQSCGYKSTLHYSLHVSLQSTGLSVTLTKGLSRVYLPQNWKPQLPFSHSQDNS